MPLPRRAMFGGANSPALMEIAAEAINIDERASQWIIGGHSRGAVVSIKLEEMLRSLGANTVAGLLLVGTTHPRDVDLSKVKLPVTKIVGTKDGVASIAKVDANRHLLPASTRATPRLRKPTWTLRASSVGSGFSTTTAHFSQAE